MSDLDKELEAERGAEGKGKSPSEDSQEEDQADAPDSAEDDATDPEKESDEEDEQEADEEESEPDTEEEAEVLTAEEPIAMSKHPAEELSLEDQMKQLKAVLKHVIATTMSRQALAETMESFPFLKAD